MTRKAPALSYLYALHQQATRTLAAINKEITRREAELTLLKAEATRWQAVAHAQQKNPSSPLPRQSHTPAGSRLQWDTVLQELPETFTARVVAQKTAKPIGQVYVGVRRWMKKKKVKKVAEGYQKVMVGRSPSPIKGDEKRKS